MPIFMPQFVPKQWRWVEYRKPLVNHLGNKWCWQSAEPSRKRQKSASTDVSLYIRVVPLVMVGCTYFDSIFISTVGMTWKRRRRRRLRGRQTKRRTWLLSCMWSIICMWSVYSCHNSCHYLCHAFFQWCGGKGWAWAQEERQQDAAQEERAVRFVSA